MRNLENIMLLDANAIMLMDANGVQYLLKIFNVQYPAHRRDLINMH